MERLSRGSLSNNDQDYWNYGVGVSAGSLFASEESAGLVALLKVFGLTAAALDTAESLAFFSGTGEAAGAATSVFCSQAPKRAAVAKIHNSFFIVLNSRFILGQSVDPSNSLFCSFFLDL